MNEKVIIPVSKDHLKQVDLNLPFIKRYLKPSSICIIGGDDVVRALHCYDNIELLNENELFDDLNYKVVVEMLRKRCGDSGRAGWYFQQFLKMQYAKICKEDHYVVWDADTIPLREISFIDDNDGKLLYNLKTEHHIPYFETIDNIFGKYYFTYGDGSFISEGMIIDVQIMKELLDLIVSFGKNGNKWFETVVDAIPLKDIPRSGFSEFETYGTYIINRYSNKYKLRQLSTMRDGYDEFGRIPEADELCQYKNHYDTITFENRYAKEMFLPEIPMLVDFKNNLVTAEKMYFTPVESKELVKHEEALIKKGNNAQRIYLYGAGHYGNQYRNFFRIKGLENKLKAFIVTNPEDTDLYGMPIISADDYLKYMHDENDLIVFCMAESKRRHILETIDLNKIDFIECDDLFAESILTIVRVREMMELIGRYEDTSNISTGATPKSVLIVDLISEVNPKELILKSSTLLDENNNMICVDMIVRDVNGLCDCMDNRIRHVYYYKTTDYPEPYSKRMERRISEFISSNSIGKYDMSILLGEMPYPKSDNYLDGAVLCMKCSNVRKGKMSVDSQIKEYFARLWNRVFEL